MRRTLAAALALAALLVFGAAGQHQTGTHPHPTGTTGAAAAHVMITPAEAKWGPAPPGLPAGALVTVLEGDPAADGPFTMRAKLPDGYTVPPHWHPQDEHVTVLEGTLLMGMGEQIAESAMKPLGVSSFAVMPKGVRHFAAARGDTIIQIHGVGPWGITYVNASDDPRNVKK
jgi:hypothetical protein